jgi:DNA-binding transcriptional MerR regulator
MTTPTELKIGILAERTGTTAPTIRYYEEIGLLPRPLRQQAGHRRYGHEDVRRLTFIRRCRDLGFPVDQVRRLVGLLDDRQRSCTEARDIGQTHLEAIRAKLAELRALEQMIADFVRDCDRSCAGGPGPDCVPLAQLTHAGPSRQVARPAGGAGGPARPGALSPTGVTNGADPGRGR